MKDHFNIKRLGRTLLWNIRTDQRSLAIHMLAIGFAFFAMQIFNTFSLLQPMVGLGELGAYQAMSFCSGAYMILTWYFATGLLANARTKASRTSMMMLPATVEEKFAARLIYCLVIIPILLIVLIVAAVGLRMLFELIFQHQNITAGFGQLWDIFALDDYSKTVAKLWLLTIFMVGGAIFRKFPFGQTWVAIMTFSVLFGLAIGIFAWMTDKESINFDTETGDAVTTAVGTVFILLNLVITYWTFLRLQGVPRKWLNI